ncbi:MAG TPA: hypothetical protein VFT95_10525, partial [Micromonosporaceae bacterium]|nr:hypothetical protein [Micromonosporaceae bacterium]
NAPGAARPWQHVLDGLGGVLLLAARLWDGTAPRRRYDFGRAAPAEAETVRTVVERFLTEYGYPDWPIDARGDGAGDRIGLGSAAAAADLGWRPVWDLDGTLRAAARWYRTARDEPDRLAAVTDEQIDQYAAAARTAWGPATTTGSTARAPGGRLIPSGA